MEAMYWIIAAISIVWLLEHVDRQPSFSQLRAPATRMLGSAQLLVLLKKRRH